MALKQAVILSGLLIVYGLLGAVIFQAVEGPKHEEQVKFVKLKRETFEEESNLRKKVVKSNMVHYIQELQSSKNKTNSTVTEEDIQSVIDRFVADLSIESQPVQTNLTLNLGWEFWDSLYFVACLCTPIGYGDMHVVTDFGKCLVVLYSVIGLVIFISLFGELALLFYDMSTYLWRKWLGINWKIKKLALKLRSSNLEKKRKLNQIGLQEEFIFTLGEKVKKKEMKKNKNVESSEPITHAPLTVALVVMIIYVGICAALFAWHEHWAYLDALYFFYVTTFTTVGLDYLKPASRRFTCLTLPVIVVELAVLSMALGLVQAKVDEAFDKIIVAIQKEYVRRVTSGEMDMELSALKLDEDEPQQRTSVKNYVNNLSWQDKLVMPLMTKHKLTMLDEKSEALSNMRNSGVQTEPDKKSVRVQTDNYEQLCHACHEDSGIHMELHHESESSSSSSRRDKRKKEEGAERKEKERAERKEKERAERKEKERAERKEKERAERKEKVRKERKEKEGKEQKRKESEDKDMKANE